MTSLLPHTVAQPIKWRFLLTCMTVQRMFLNKFKRIDFFVGHLQFIGLRFLLCQKKLVWLLFGEVHAFPSYKKHSLTAVFFETGAMSVPTKSRNPTICGWGDLFQSYLTPFLRVLSISGFLKVIHAPKTPKRGFFQVPRKSTSSIAFFKSLHT